MKRCKVTHPLVIALAKARYDAELSQAAVASRIGVTPAAVGNWEAGAHPPRVDNLTAWAEALGFDVALIPKKETPKC